MKKLFCKKYGCILGVGILCLAIYLPACLIIPPLLGAQKKSDAQPRLPMERRKLHAHKDDLN